MNLSLWDSSVPFLIKGKRMSANHLIKVYSSKIGERNNRNMIKRDGVEDFTDIPF